MQQTRQSPADRGVHQHLINARLERDKVQLQRVFATAELEFDTWKQQHSHATMVNLAYRHHEDHLEKRERARDEVVLQMPTISGVHQSKRHKAKCLHRYWWLRWPCLAPRGQVGAHLSDLFKLKSYCSTRLLLPVKYPIEKLHRDLSQGWETEFDTAQREWMDTIRSIIIVQFGSMPCLFAYAAAHSSVQFYAIDRSRKVHEILPRLDVMNLLQNRIQCVVMSLTICRSLYYYPELLPQGFLRLYETVARNNGTSRYSMALWSKFLQSEPYASTTMEAIYLAVHQDTIRC